MKKTFSVSKETVDYIETYSKKQSVSQSQIIETAMQLYMAIKNGISSDISIRKNKAYVTVAHKNQTTIDDFE